MKKNIKWIILVVVLTVGGGLYVYADRQSGMPVQTASVSPGTIRAWVEERAMTTLPFVHKITMPQDGRILPIALEAGDAVSANQIVAQMDEADLKTAIVMADAQVAGIQSEIAMNKYEQMEKTGLAESRELIAAMKAVGKAADELIRANEVELKYSKWLVEMEKNLVEQKASSREKLRRAERDYGQADSAVASAQFTSKAAWAITTAVELFPSYIQERLHVKHLETEVLNQRLAIARGEREMAARRLERAALKSPVDGMVLRRLVKNEEFLSAGTLLMEIGTMGALEVTVDILSQDVVAVRPGNAVDIHGPAIGDSPLQGTVLRIEPAGFTKVSSLGVDQQRVSVKIAFDEGALDELKKRGRTLGLAYRIRVRIYTSEKKDVLKVPRTALFKAGGNQWQVFSVKNGKAVTVPVTLGIVNDSEAEITGGLKEGEPIVTVPPKALTDGDRVKLL